MSDTDLAFRATLDGSGFASGAQRINGQLQQMGFHTQTATAGLGGIGTMLGTMANPATAAALAVTALGGALVGSAQSAAAWQTSMTGVAKTTGLGGADLAELSDQLLTMSTNMPVAASGLAEIAQVGGSLGIAKEELAGFTEVAAQMGVGFEMSAEQAATAGAKILNAFGQEMNTENLRSLGSVVNAMGDSFAATEPQVLDFLNRASFLNTTMGQSIPQVAALGTTLVSAGMEAETAATGIKSAINMLTSETSKKGGMDNWAKLMGTDVDTLKEKIASDLNGTLIETANTIASMADPTERFQAAVAAAGTEGAPALLKLAGAGEDYAKALGMSNSEWENATSLQKTYDAQMSTVTSQWTIFTNTLSMASTALGTGLLPYLADALGFMTDVAKIGMKVAEVIGSWDLGEKVSEVFKNSPMGMLLTSDTVTDAVSGAWGDLKNWAGIGTEHAEQMAKEIEENDNLKKAAAEALDTPEAKAAMEKAAWESAEEFSKEWVQGFEKAQGSRDIAKILARTGNESLTKNKGNIAGWAATTLENGLEVQIAYQGRGNELMSRLFIDGQQIGGPVYGTREEGIRELLKRWQYDQGNVYELMDEPGNAAVWRSSQHLVNIADLIFAPETAIKSKIKELTDAAKAAFEDGIMTMGKDSEQLNLLGLAQDLDMLHARFPQEFEKIGGEAIKELEDALKRNDIVKAMAILGEVAGEEFVDALTGTIRQMKIPSIDEVLADPELQAKIMDLPDFLENTFNPALKKSFDDQYAITKLGYDDDISQTKAWIDEKEKIYQEHANWFSDWQQELFRMYAGNEISAEDFMWVWNEMSNTASKSADEIGKATEKASVGYDQLGKALEDCNECMSDFGNWQEAQTDLFQDSYIGRGGQAYLDWKNQQISAIAEIQAAMDAVGGAVLGQRYDMPSYTMQVDADTNTAEAKKESLIAEITSANPILRMELDTSIADSRFQNFFNLVQNSRPVMYFDAIPLVDIGAIAAAVESALRSAGI